ncbi:uncharacterized protein LOC106661050 [Cimex lectularius]|uniref:Bromo domain-containing protein n=1 Tax=Cimex lectularius TaxID=79782 RepID=A0A8I6R755_CIMLE|nr:uncharacterized protein LOC106661050 [Cimex lectularius]XP_014239648.1 uncharacterized protein LOC106661050 [Cimex lectularius]XP_014239658.1 uncharacterized protein LOC106661050 [Cimex lectularius]XP_024084118.1 uncharacterized protein LOC106661050 [Cimex lectularius]
MDLETEGGCHPEEGGHKRGKKKKLVQEVYDPLPPKATEGKNFEISQELEYANRILQAIMKLKNIQPFYEKPNPDSFGMSSYYKIVKEPMWLYEVKRKLEEGEYNGLSDFVKDMRLLLENCYRFWGVQHRITKKGLLMEHKLEQRLQEIPKPLLDKLNRENPDNNQEVDVVNNEVQNLPFVPNEIVDLDDYEENDEAEAPVDQENQKDQEDMNDMEENESNSGDFDEDSNNSTVYSSSVVYYTTKVFQSKILEKVLKNEVDEEDEADDSEEAKELEQKMLSWERENLVTEEIQQEIRKMWQLAEIGHFLKLTFEVLNVEEMTQYEVERMLLMPRESLTLTTLMTSMLSPEIKRASLDESPLMPYEVWTGKLSRKIEEWLGVFYLSNDRLEVYEKIGIEPYFWDVIRLTNPLTEKRFHEISFFQRVYIVKSLCNNLLHTNKTIQDLFNEENPLVEGIRPVVLGKDAEGSKYISLPFLPEIRIYKETKVLNKTLSQWRTPEGCVFKLQKFHITPVWDEDEQQINVAPSETFSLIADDLDSLIALIEESKENELFSLVTKLNQYQKEARSYRIKCDGLRALYQQWNNYQNRPPEYFTNMLNLWLRTEKPVVQTVQSNPNESGDLGESSSCVLGKRRSVTMSFKGFNSDADDFFDSDSDWEANHKKRRRRGPKKKAKESKEQKMEFNSTSNSIIENNDSSMASEGVNESFQQAGSKQVDFEETKPTLSELNAYMAKAENKNNIEKLDTPTPSIRVVPLAKMKEEKADDVICISSDEDKDDDVVLSGANQIKKTITNVQSLTQQVTVQQVSLLHMPEVKKQVLVPVSNQSSVTPMRIQRPRSFPTQETRQRAVTIQNVRVPMPQTPVFPQNRGRIVMPSPMKQQQVVMPQPIPAAGAQQQTWQRSPRQQSPRQQYQYSPRARTPTSPMTRMRTPTTPVNNRAMTSPRQMTPRALFNSPNRAQQRAVPAPINSSPDTIEGMLTVGSDPDGTYRYRVKLSDGGIINLSRAEVEDIRQKNNGILPQKVNVPLVKRKGF